MQPEAEEAAEPVPDLMAALKASLDAVRDRRRRRSAPAKRKKPAAKSKRAKAAAPSSRAKAAAKKG